MSADGSRMIADFFGSDEIPPCWPQKSLKSERDLGFLVGYMVAGFGGKSKGEMALVN